MPARSVRKGNKVGYQWTIEYNFTMGNDVPVFAAAFEGRQPAFVEVVSSLITGVSQPLGGSFAVAFGSSSSTVELAVNDTRGAIASKLSSLPGVNSEQRAPPYQGVERH